MSATQTKTSGDSTENRDWLEIVVHDSQVTQIEKTERVRLDKPRQQNLSQPENRRRKIKNKRMADRTIGSGVRRITKGK